MIEPQEIEALELELEPPHPPVETGSLVRFPCIERIAPELALLVEVVGRHARDRGRPAVGIEAEQVRLPPDIDAVHVDVERQIAEQIHAAGVRVALQRRPRKIEQILTKRDRAEPLALLGENPPQLARRPHARFLWPLPPRRTVEAPAQDLEKPVRQQ